MTMKFQIYVTSMKYKQPFCIEQKPQVGDERVVSIGPFERDIACTSIHQEHGILKKHVHDSTCKAKKNDNDSTKYKIRRGVVH